MAIIGLLDWDLIRWKQPSVFNLELMKLSTYHKLKCHDIVQMENAFSSDMCTKVYIQKDYEDFDYPREITEDPKVLWRGLALSNNIYQPMDLEIEKSFADTSIYNNFSKYYDRTGEARQVFRNLLKANHLRLTLDGVHPFDGWEKQLKQADGKTRHIIFHDKNLIAIKDTKEIIDNICNEYGRGNVRIGFKFPLEVYTEDDFLSWSMVTKTPNICDINIYSLLSDETISEIIPYKQKLIYCITNKFWTQETFIEALPKILMQGIFLSRHSITLLLKIDRNFILDNHWINFVKLYNSYIQNCVMYRAKLLYCCFTYCKHSYYDITREEKIELFNYIKENNKELFDLLYGAEYVTYNNGTLEPHMYTTNEIFAKGGYGIGIHKKRTNKIDRA